MTQAKSRPFRNIALLLATIPVAAWLSWKNRDYQLDDSLIYLRYVRNLFDGLGLTYNAGDHFNGLTSPLYSYLLIAANSVTHSLQYTTIFLSFVFLCAAAIYGAAALSENRFEQALCGFFVVSFNYFYTTFGMETTLFLFLTALTLHFYRNDRLYLVGATIGFLILTRTEGVFLGAVIFGHYIFTRKRIPPLKYLVVAAAIILANLLFNYLYYGAPLPATGNAKIGQGRSGFWGTRYPFLNVMYMKDWFFGGDYRLLWFLFPSAVIGLFARRSSATAYLTVAYLALLGGFYVFLHIPNYHWYYAPFFYFLVLFSAIGAYQLISMAIGLAKKRKAYLLAAVPVTIVTAVFGAHNLKLADIVRGSFDPYRSIGNWINDNTPKSAVVAAVEIGTIGWYGNRYIIDILGLTNPYNADFIANKDVHSWLTKYSPDYILVHDPLWPFEATATCLTSAGAYAPEPRFNFPGYHLLVKSAAPGAKERATACGQTG
ncbi:hypothetical protein WS70_13625 [Burkholderia mayonis]|uniref:Glycosyltransferase RgtA/B/C/D-like domain-containing protein n=1 Tax=Burkholderia mayonis TaxID=1385591 RepID=A0A1B4FGA2_9BURK|nr:hypothetical protein [Burkholderia mayonis]AOJ02738.1 hypothetical protein WS70_13625 [Burkholderia mayonis]KVE45117.1 hypothetical protein WS70_05685 [Burkholderia mayonis]